MPRYYIKKMVYKDVWCNSWEMALNVSLDMPFNKNQDCKGIWQKVREVNITNDQTSC
jgi:hypothetical protein